MLNRLLLGISCAVLFLPALSGQENDAGAPEIRERLERRGLAFGASYTGEEFTNGKGAGYLGVISSRVDFDLGRLGFSRGQVVVSAQSLHGKGINAGLVGAIQGPSNLEEERFSKLVEAWYADSYFDGKLRIKAGRQYADGEFGVIENGGDFLNTSYGVLPTAPMPTYPNPQLGVSAWAAPAGHVSLGAGVYRASPAAGGTFAVAESRVSLSHQNTCRFGLWQQGAHHGMYATAERRFAGEGERNTALFARWGWTPAALNDVGAYAGGGFVHRGFGAGVTTVRPAAGDVESVFELFYKRRVKRKLILQPDLQWIVNPGGSGSQTVAAGMRVIIEL